MANTQYDAIIIGAGHNGLTTAGYLAKDGLSVLVLERQDIVGGASGSEEIHPGFVANYCASICHSLQGRVIDDLKLREHGLEIIPFKFNRFHPFPDGSYIQLGPDARANFEQLARFSKSDAAAFGDWNSFMERARGILYRYWLQEPPTLAQVFADVRGTQDEEVLETLLTVSVKDHLDTYFESDQIKAHLLGAPDAGNLAAPGSIFSEISVSATEFSKPENVGYPKGGIGKIAEAMARSAQANGAEIRTKTRVEKIIVEEGEARGVRLDSGEELRSFIVVSNADPKNTFLNLLDPETLDTSFATRVKNLRTKACSMKFLAALKELPDFSRYLGQGYDRSSVVTMKICPSVDYALRSWDDAKNGRFPQCPVMLINFPSIVDDTVSPPGHHVMTNWMFWVPWELNDGSWSDAREEVAEHILDILTEYAPNFRDSLVDWTLQTPEDIATREAMTNGNIRHLDMVPGQLLARRMPYRAPVKRLYLCGAGTHPGGEVTAAPGHNAAKAILKDLEKAAV